MTSTTQSTVMESEPIVLYNDPLLLCDEDNIRTECTFVFKTMNNDIIPNSSLIFEPNFSLSKEVSGRFPAGTTLNVNGEVPYHLARGPSNANNEMQIMQIVYKNIPNDQPEFVDVNNLTSFEHIELKSFAKESIVLSDDENDVIFVKEYKQQETEENKPVYDGNDGTKEDGIRRNPVREARINKGGKHLQKEHLLEEDFAFLDQFDDENLVHCNSKSSSSTISAESGVEEYKEWPINVFERPEYNPQTNKIEPFDYTIRNIQNKQIKKKARLETCTKVKRKPKKKYIIRKRKPKSKKPVEKVPVTQLNEVVTSTFNMFSTYLKNSNDFNKKTDFSVLKDDLYNLIKNQTVLMAVVKNYDERELSECVSKLLSKS